MKEVNLTCINCPMGCALCVTIDDNENISVSGNTCPRGAIYGKNEVVDPKRIITSSISVINKPRVSCKSSAPIKKDLIFDVMKEIKKTRLSSPVRIGDILIENVCGTNVNIVATKNID